MIRSLPPPPVLRRSLVRAAWVWLVLRGVLFVGSRAARPPVPMPDALVGTPLTALLIAALTVAAVAFEMWRRREFTFVRNLGVFFAPLAGLVAAGALTADVLLRVLVGA